MSPPRDPFALSRRAFLGTSAAAALAAASTLPAAASASPSPAPAPVPEDDLSKKDVPPLGPEVYRERVARVREEMERAAVDAIFLTASPYLSYLTGIELWRSERLAAIVIPRRGELALVSAAFESISFRERAPEVRDVRVWQEHEDPYAVVRSVLDDRGALAGKLAIEPTTPYFVARGVSAAAPSATLLDGSAVIDPLRTVKSPAELAIMRRAIEITEEAFRRGFLSVTKETTETTLGATVNAEFSTLGAPGGGALILFGPNAAFPHGTLNRRKATPGDSLLVDGGCKVRGYSSDITRTVAFGEASPKLREVFEVVRDAQRAGFKTAGPGVPCEEVDRAARDVIERAGYGKYFTHRLGHGIGLDGHERPYLVRGNKTQLAAGNTTTVEPGIYIPGELGVRIEDQIAVTPNGCEVLSHPPDAMEILKA